MWSIADKIVHTGEYLNTAIRFPAADTVTVETAGTERMRITSTGRVGIGTSSPDYPFEVEASGGGEGASIAVTNTGSDPARLRLNSGHGNWSVSNSVTIADALEFRDESANSTRAIIDSSGNGGDWDE
jgi:hypothetical protein